MGTRDTLHTSSERFIFYSVTHRYSKIHPPYGGWTFLFGILRNYANPTGLRTLLGTRACRRVMYQPAPDTATLPKSARGTVASPPVFVESGFVDVAAPSTFGDGSGTGIAVDLGDGSGADVRLGEGRGVAEYCEAEVDCTDCTDCAVGCCCAVRPTSSLPQYGVTWFATTRSKSRRLPYAEPTRASFMGSPTNTSIR